MIRVKPGVVFHPDSFTNPEVMRIIHVTGRMTPEDYDTTITSATEGEHKQGSHQEGKAFDFRTRDFPASVQVWADRIRKRLGDAYFILVESDHLHIQYNG